MKVFMSSVRALFVGMYGYVKTVWKGALETLSMRAVDIAGEEPHGGRALTATQSGSRFRRGYNAVAGRSQMLFRRLQRGRSWTQRNEWRAGKP